MTDWIPKFSDVKSLQDLAKVLALPMVMASWVLQSGLQLDFPNSEWALSIPKESELWIKVVLFIIIFFGKCIYAAICGGLVYAALAFATIFTKVEWLLLAAIFLLAFGIFGLAGGIESVEEFELHGLWFYTAVVYAFFLHGANKDMSDA